MSKKGTSVCASLYYHPIFCATILRQKERIQRKIRNNYPDLEFKFSFALLQAHEHGRTVQAELSSNAARPNSRCRIGVSVDLVSSTRGRACVVVLAQQHIGAVAASQSGSAIIAALIGAFRR